MNCLGKKEGNTIVHVLSGLFTYANVKEGKRLKSFEDMNRYLVKGAEKVFADANSSQVYIEEYLCNTPSIKYRDQALLAQWSGCYKRDMYLFGDGDQYSYAYVPNEDKVYGVKGLTHELSGSLLGRPAPHHVFYAILPYKDAYICDALSLVDSEIDITKNVNLYEAFRTAAIRDGVQISKDQIEPLLFVDREHGSKDQIFEDFMQPFFMMFGQNKEILTSALQCAAFAWNRSLQSEEEQANATNLPKDIEFMELCMKRRETCFPNVNFKVEQFKLFVEHKQIRIHIEEKEEKTVEQITFDFTAS